MQKESVCAVCDCVIKDNTFFSDLTGKHVELFKESVATSLYKKGEVVFLEGDTCTGLYIIRYGRVKVVRSSVSGKEQIIKILEPGELLGLEAFYHGEKYSNTAVAMEEGDLCYIERDRFFDILKNEPEISARLIGALSRELDHAYERIGNLGLLSAREKLAHLLLSLSREYGVVENGTVRLHLNLSRLEIAELLGITQETSIRLLKSFKEEGILDIRRKELVIKSVERLSGISGAGD